MNIYNEKNILVFFIKKLSFLRIIILTFIVYGSLNYSGFCFEEMRYLSDEEKIRGAISNYIIDSRADWYSTHGIFEKIDENRTRFKGDEYQKKIPYANVDMFLKENPDCCILNQGGGEDHLPEFWEKIFGRCNYFVKMSYTEKYIEKHLKEPIEHNVEGWEQKRDEVLNKIKGQESKRFVESNVFIANNCGNFCRED